MKLRSGLLIAATFTALSAAALAAESDKPNWAYAVPDPSQPAPPLPAGTPGEKLSLPGSKFQFTRRGVQGQADDGSRTRVQPADWYPEEHPAMPPIVALGSADRHIISCSLCHMPEGRGRSENGSLAGLPRDYIVEQLHDWQQGLRASAEPGKLNAKEMADFAKGMTEDEVQAVATYYSSIPWITWEKVVETDTVPKTVSVNGMWVPIEGPGAGSEPLGERIIEVPANPERTEVYRDPHSGFISYVPKGALAAGKKLVTTGGDGKTMACAGCHGEGLRGMGSTPGIAGRSASYIARQLFDFQAGTRHGAGAQMMQPVAAKLDGRDLIDISAYVASLPVK